MLLSVTDSSTMLILRGSPALSQFRLQKLIQDLNAAGVPVRAISSEFVHVAELDCDDRLVGTPFSFEAYDFTDIANDAGGGVVLLTRDAHGAAQSPA